LLLEFPKTGRKRWLVERLDLLPMAVLLMIGADFLSFALILAQHSRKLPVEASRYYANVSYKRPNGSTEDAEDPQKWGKAHFIAPRKPSPK